MSKAEAAKVVQIMLHADGVCSSCASGLVGWFNEGGFGWQFDWDALAARDEGPWYDAQDDIALVERFLIAVAAAPPVGEGA